MNYKYSWLAIISLPILVIIYSFMAPPSGRSMGGNLPETYNELFAGSGTCLMCHNSMVNSSGEPVSVIADWRSSVMANAARDPFWRAKVSHEGLVNPEHKEALEDVCTRCHAPTGNINAHHIGQELYSIEEMENDPLAMDGVQCTVCHQIREEGLGNFSGTFEIGDQKKIYGPYEDPFTNSMVNHTGYTPEYSTHIHDSRVCASCHTLITNSVDNNGQPSGNQFVEQAIYQEWKNSNFSQYNTQCHVCHLPRISDTVVISTMPPWLEGRSPFGKHHFQGANVFILRMLKEFGEELGVTASSAQFDSTINRNLESLQQRAVEINLQEIDRTEDTLYIDVQSFNTAGHKLPSGYPSRRVFVELTVIDENDDIIFHSGAMDTDHQLIEEDASYEPHYNTITAEDQVQIYEMVMGDINYEVTTVLERANFLLKDNRIPPGGFTSSHYVYDTVPIVGEAESDADFNRTGTTEGSGSDILHFHIPVNGYQGLLKATVMLHYQSVSSKWLEHMFTYSSDEIDVFKTYYEAIDKSPVLMASDSVNSNYSMTGERILNPVSIFPNPASSMINIQAPSTTKTMNIRVINMQGKQVDIIQVNNNKAQVDISSYPRGFYFVIVDNGNIKTTRKFLKN